ncbi:MAG: methyltransferase [Candidatus Omnitrophota bacterium]|nr:methyltransferase [Candidatus Omnitrophota bacterium]
MKRKMPDQVFKLTATSKILIRAVMQAIQTPGKLLDLGCGTGIVGISLANAGKATFPVYFSDVSEDAITYARNVAFMSCKECVAKAGSLFEPWHGEKFDTIVDDVSGVSEPVAKLSPWFQGVACDTDRDGTRLICQVLKETPDHLNPGGRLFFPVLSLSDEKKILSCAKDHFKQVRILAEQIWFLPPELHNHLELLQQLSKEGLIRLEWRFGKWCWYTQIWEASND